MLMVTEGIKEFIYLIPAMLEMKHFTVQAEITLKLFGNHIFYGHAAPLFFAAGQNMQPLNLIYMICVE